MHKNGLNGFDVYFELYLLGKIGFAREENVNRNFAHRFKLNRIDIAGGHVRTENTRGKKM